MEFAQVIKRAKEIRKLYAEFERKKFGKEWTREQIFQGFVGDVGDLAKLLIAADGVSEKHADLSRNEIKQKVAHELTDCLWSIVILADKYDIDLENVFADTMDNIESKINN
jgi:NTP pyrophosphatase (non-canonical NTP hydrolase)